MQMSEGEIVRSYNHAENRTKQISILAELNACSKAEIRDILEKNGEEVPHYGNRYTGKVKEVTEANGSKRKLSGVRMSERRKKKNELKEAVEDISVGLNAMVRDAAEGLNKVIKDNPADSSKMSARLLKSEEQAGVIKSEEPSGVIKSDEPTAKDLAEFGEAFMQGVRDGLKEAETKEDLGLSFEHKPEEMLKARAQKIPPEVIAITMMKINDLKLDMGAIQEEMDKLQTELQDKVKICNRLSVWLDEVMKEGKT